MKIKIIKSSDIQECKACSSLMVGQTLNVEDEMAKDLVDKGIADYVIE